MNPCVAVLLLSCIAFSECFVHRGNMVFPIEDWELQNHQTRTTDDHRKDDFDNHQTNSNNQNVLRTRTGLRGSTEESSTKSAKVKIIEEIKNFRKGSLPRKYIVGDFVFPHQVEDLRNWRTFINTPTKNIVTGSFSTNQEKNIRVRSETEKAPPTNIVGDFVFPDQRENYREKKQPKMDIVQDFVFPDQRKNFEERKLPHTDISVFPDQSKNFRVKRCANKELSSNIIGDFVFPDQVMNYKKEGDSPLLKAVFGIERGKDQRRGNY